jgi:hypothetical protein
MMPTVSICLPVFNGTHHLAEAVDSALAQTYTDFELLIADDCSSDDSSNIIDKYAKRDKRILAWRNESNQGLFANYNICIRRASGIYIKPFAQDDVLHPALLDRLVGVLDSDPSVSLVACARAPINTDGLPIKPDSEIESKCAKPFPRDTRVTAVEAIGSTFKDGINWLGEPSAQMYRSEVAGGGFDTSFRQIGDLENSLRLLQFGDYYFIADELCYIRKHTGSSTAVNDVELAAHLDWLLLGAKYRDYLSQAGLTPEEYCLSFIKSWTRNLECELNRTQRLGEKERANVLHEFSGYADPLSPLLCEKNGARHMSSEYKMLGALALLQCSLLEHELRMVHEEVARPHTQTKLGVSPMVEVRSGLTAALTGLKQTLIERDKEIASLRAMLNTMGNSASWKLTEPLRKAKDHFRLPRLCLHRVRNGR